MMMITQVFKDFLTELLTKTVLMKAALMKVVLTKAALAIVVISTVSTLTFANENSLQVNGYQSSSYQVHRYEVKVGSMPNLFSENTYLLVDKTTNSGVILDPGNRDRDMEKFIAESKIDIKLILNTHGHYDHVGANGYYAKKYGVEVYGNKLDADLYQDVAPENYLSVDLQILNKITFANNYLKIIKTPGHSAGSVCLLIDNILFSGDTLFKNSIGRTWGKDESEISRKRAQEINSVKSKLLILPDETIIYPGHGDDTTIGSERSNNPFLKNQEK